MQSAAGGMARLSGRARRRAPPRIAVWGLLASVCAGLSARPGAAQAPAAAQAAATPAVSAAPPVGKKTIIHVAGDIAYPNGWKGEAECEASAGQLFDEVRPYLATGQVNFANLEMPLTRRPAALVKQSVIVARPHRLQWIQEAGFNLLSIANNHIFDAGKPGLLDTLATLRAASQKQPLGWAGAGATKEEARALTIVKVAGSGLRVGLLALGNITAPLVASFDKSFYARVREAAQKVDVLLVSIHSGQEYQHRQSPSAAQRYRRIIEAGARAVLVHHAHVVAGVERYQGGVIFHGLGNLSFCSKQHRFKTFGAQMYGMLGRLELDGAALSAVTVVPLYVGNVEPLSVARQKLAPRFGRPQVLHGDFAQRVLGAIVDWSKSPPVRARNNQHAIRGDVLWIGESPAAPLPSSARAAR